MNDEKSARREALCGNHLGDGVRCGNPAPCSVHQRVCPHCDQVLGHAGSCVWTGDDLARVKVEAERVSELMGPTSNADAIGDEIEGRRSEAASPDVLARLAAWTHEYGAALKPSGTDTYGEGVRDCKAQVARILATAPRTAETAEVSREVHDRGWQWRPVGDDVAFAPPFGTIRVCECGCLVAGGPTRCTRCANEPCRESEEP